MSSLIYIIGRTECANQVIFNRRGMIGLNKYTTLVNTET